MSCMNSLHNLYSIGPPSIMDELMNSIFSVSSITTELEYYDGTWIEVTCQRIVTKINTPTSTPDPADIKTVPEQRLVDLEQKKNELGRGRSLE